MFINKNVEGERERGVCATALAEDASLSGGRRGKRAGYFLLSSSGSGRRKGRDEPGDRRGEEESLPGSVHIPHRFTWRVAPLPFPILTCVPGPRSYPAPHCNPSGRQRSAQPAQRSAQPTQRSAAQPGRRVVPRGRAVLTLEEGQQSPPSSLEAPQWQWQQWLQVELRAQVTLGATQGGEGVGWGAQQLGQGQEGGRYL